MKLAQLCFIIALTLLMSTTGYSEFYKYTDKDGIVRYTDDLSVIPENQRSDLQTFESSENQGGERESPTKNQSYSAEGQTTGITSSAKKGHQPNKNLESSTKQKKSEELDAMRKKLRQTYKEINAKRKALGDPPPHNAKSGVKAEYIRKSEALNKQIKEYNKLQNEFDQKVKEYNQEISQK